MLSRLLASSTALAIGRPRNRSADEPRRLTHTSQDALGDLGGSAGLQSADSNDCVHLVPLTQDLCDAEAPTPARPAETTRVFTEAQARHLWPRPVYRS